MNLKQLASPGQWFGTKALSSLPRDPFWFGGLIHEPFLGAWQRNMEQTNSRDPSLIAVSSVFSCVTIIAQDVSKLPLRLFRKLASDPAPVLAENHPITFVLKQPNKYQTWLDFMQYHTAAKLMTGNSYVYKVLDQRGVVILVLQNENPHGPVSHPVSRQPATGGVSLRTSQ